MDDDSTVTGQPFTVLLDGKEGWQVPREVNLVYEQAKFLANQAGNGKHVKIFFLVGMRALVLTVFTSLDKAHLSVPPKSVRQPITMRQRRRWYLAPSITSSMINSNSVVLTEWRALLLSLHKWNEKLCIVTNASNESPASSAAMEMQETFFRTNDLNSKTPPKCKHSPDEGESPALSLLDMSAYSPFFKDDE